MKLNPKKAHWIIRQKQKSQKQTIMMDIDEDWMAANRYLCLEE